MRSKLLLIATAVLAGAAMPASAVVNYSIDDGTAERTVTIDPGEDQIWFNTFPVIPGGERITAVSAAFGRPGLEQFPLDGLAIKVLVYEDPDLGSPTNATLLASVDGVVSGAHTNTLVRYEIPPVVAHGRLFVGVLFRNTTDSNQPIAALDETNPDYLNRSWAGYTLNGMDETNLTTIPAGQLRLVEELGVVGNFLIRAEGQPIPEPSTALGAILFAVAGLRRPSRPRQVQA